MESDLPAFDKIVADSDLDGLCGAAILKKHNPDAEVIFSHAALIRSGANDDIIDDKTVIVDLPFHANCGWYVDHHKTNMPNDSQLEEFIGNNKKFDWQPTPSAARLAYELVKEHTNLANFVDSMSIVDDLDSGNITLEEFKKDGTLLKLSRTLGLKNRDYMIKLVDELASGKSFEEIFSLQFVAEKISKVSAEREQLEAIVARNTTIIDRLAICRLDNTGFTSNGYVVTAWAGEAADACCIIHGYQDGTLEDLDRPPLSASFYANSFLEDGQNKFDLSKLATRFDENGGGHVNACGCRIQPPGLEANLSIWLDMWRNRNEDLAI